MIEKNTLLTSIIPETPKITPQEQIFLYVPIVTSKSPGIAKFNEHFDVSQDGTVSLHDDLKIKIDKLVINGNGTKYLSNDGEYKEIDLSKYQLKHDDSLETKNKTIVGAINEINKKPGQVEANPTEEATEDLLKLKVGDKTYLIPASEGSNLDVQIDGISIVQDGVANIPTVVDKGNAGIVTTDGTTYGIRSSANGLLFINSASRNVIFAKTTDYLPIVPKYLDYAVKVGLTTNTEILTDEEKEQVQEWLGISKDTQLYRHTINSDVSTPIDLWNITFVSTRNVPYTAFGEIFNPNKTFSDVFHVYGRGADADGSEIWYFGIAGSYVLYINNHSKSVNFFNLIGLEYTYFIDTVEAI